MPAESNRQVSSPPQREGQVRVFISSTFRDPAARGTERDHLFTVVFPELRLPSPGLRQAGEWWKRLWLEFFDVDVRFRLRPSYDRLRCASQGYAGQGRVPAKDPNGESANSWEYCRQWIDRVEPFFVCILGQSQSRMKGTNRE